MADANNSGAEALLDAAREALMAGRSHDALQLCDRAALTGAGGRYGAALLRGTILLDIGDAAGALSSYDSVADPQVPDAALDCARGIALFELARLAEADNALRSALRGDGQLARAHFCLGLIAELAGNNEEAEHFRRARRLEPENYPPQRRVGGEEFQRAVSAAIDGLGDGVREVLSKISVLVAELPNPKDLMRQTPPVSPQAPCMLVGVLESGADPNEDIGDVEVGLLLFKRNLERLTQNEADLTGNVRTALLQALEGTFEGEPLRSDDANGDGQATPGATLGDAASGQQTAADEQPSSDGQAAFTVEAGRGPKPSSAAAAAAQVEADKLQDLSHWRRKKQQQPK